MPIDPAQQTDPDLPRYSLPLDSCVGDDGPTPEEVTVISQPAGKTPDVPARLQIAGGRTEGWAGPSGRSPGQSVDARAAVPVGYDGPEGGS